MIFFSFFFFAAALFTPDDSIISQTDHKIVIDTEPLLYKATVQYFPVLNEDGQPLAKIYCTSYCKRGKFDRSERPITFCFDGGPGGSSAFLQLGGFGPKRCLTQEEGQSLTAPYRWVENFDTLLKESDLVFVDPVGTGWSRAEEAGDELLFYDSLSDISSIRDLIFDYLTKEGRWKSPKYLAGFSYGTFRVCGLCSSLLSYGVSLNGIILLSCAVDFDTFEFGFNNHLPYSLYLPCYAATAWHHRKLPPEMTFQEAIEGATAFFTKTFGPALFLQRKVPVSLYENLAFWTGLPLDLIRRYDGMIDVDTFIRNCCASEKKVIGRYDSRLTGDLLHPLFKKSFIDPGVQTAGIFCASFYAYLKEELGCTIEWPRYETSSFEALQKWRYHTFSTLKDLQYTLIANPEMKIFIGSGYFDLRTPFTSTEYTFKNLHVPQEENLILRTYEGGHDFISNPKVMKQLKEDLAPFFGKK